MRTRTLLFGLGLVVAASFGIVVAHRIQQASGPALSAEAIADQPRVSSSGNQLPILWPAPAFSYLDQDRRTVTDRDLRGHVWISDFFFTSCTSICPTMTAAMSELQRTIVNPDVRFISFSVDPEQDTPERLKEYAKMWTAEESRWRFLRTEKVKLVETAKGMRTFVRPPDKDSSIQHSSLFILTDPAGMVRGVYDSNEQTSLRQLAVDALTLAGTPPKDGNVQAANWPSRPASALASSPDATFYARCGCLACHAQGRVAPPLEGLFGRAVLLDDGSTVIADEAYLRESLLDPNAKVVAGYPRLMPSYQDQLTPSEIDRLVCYVESLGGDVARIDTAGVTGAKQHGEAIDPVCGMTVTAGPGLPPAEFGGKTYYFCSEACRQQFLGGPTRFVASSSDSTGRSR